MRELYSFARHFGALVRFARPVLLGLLLMLLLIACVISLAEDLGFGDALYFTLITGLTVGYGDIVPATTIGRIASVIAALTGLVLSGLYIAIATKALSLAVEEVGLAERRDSRDDG